MKACQFFWICLAALVAFNGRAFAQPAALPQSAGSDFAVEQGPVIPEGPGSGKDEQPGGATDGEKGRLSDLTLGNFFSAGWAEDSVRRERASGTPDLALLRVQTNFMERELRVNYFHESNINGQTRANLDSADAVIAYAFNRRFMIEVLGNYQWFGDHKGPEVDGGDPQLIGRVQLIDTETSSYAFNFRAQAPDRGVGEQKTTLSYGLAGFEDLAPLDRVGLYYSVQFDTLAGPREPGAKQNDVAYDITIAKTLTRPNTPIFGAFTVFVEHFAQTNLDGALSGRTLVEITPGVCFNLGKSDRVRFGKDNWILFGTDIPISGPRPWNAIYRLSYIKNF